MTRILLVDDDPALLDALSETLRLRLPQVICETTESATQALERVASEDYAVVVSDIKMPGMDGLELLRTLREISPDLPVMLITGHGETHLAIEALRSGAYDLIQKPLDRDYLLTSLTRAIEASYLRREVAAKTAKLEEYARELEARVQSRTAELTKANHAKDEFLGLVSHELRTPITVILGNAEVLRRRGDLLSNQVKDQALNDLVTEARRLQRIVENLLILARLDHQQELEQEPVLVRNLVHADVEEHRKLFPARCINVHSDGDLPLVLATPAHIEIVLRNLLSNAEKYSPPDAPIDVILSGGRSRVTVAVCDRGPGLDGVDVSQLFTAFYRSPEASQMAAGMGIGLAVCRRVIEAAGGEIWARPRPGGGSEFGFSLNVTSDVGSEAEPHLSTAASLAS